LRLQLVLEPAYDVTSLDFLDLLRCVKINKIVDVHEATTDTHLDLITFFYFHVDALLSERVDTFRLSQEENLDSVAFRILVDVVSKVSIDLVHLMPDTDMLCAFHELLHVYHKLVDFVLCFLVLNVPLVVMLLNSQLSFIQFLACLLQLLVRLLQFLVRFVQLLDGVMQFFFHSIKLFFLILQILIKILNIIFQIASLLFSFVSFVVFFSECTVKRINGRVEVINLTLQEAILAL
jgi:hypothetical protein